MLNRLLFIGVAAFWVTMNVLLYRSEFARKYQPGAEVPVRVVWQKILTAPDNSNMEIRDHGKRIGFARWAANIGEEAATGKTTSEYPPEGMVRKLTGYTLDMDGTVAIGDRTNRYRFYVSMRFDKDDKWQEFSFRVSQRPKLWEVRADNAMETLSLLAVAGDDQWDRTIKFEELRNPDKLMQDIAGPMVGPMLNNTIKGYVGEFNNPSIKLDWEARHDWVKLNFTEVRVYRLHAHLMDRYDVVVYVSRVGEIFRVELPNGITLVNEEFR